MILHCVKSTSERELFQEPVRVAGRDWSLVGVLGTEGEAEGRRAVRKALLFFLGDTRLIGRIPV